MTSDGTVDVSDSGTVVEVGKGPKGDAVQEVMEKSSGNQTWQWKMDHLL